MAIKRTHTQGGPIVIRTTVTISTAREQMMFELLAELEGDIQAYQLARLLMSEALQYRYDTDVEFRHRLDELWEAQVAGWREQERQQAAERRANRRARERRQQMRLVENGGN